MNTFHRMPQISSIPSDARQRFEGELVEVFAELADLFGNPRSHGQIYGLLFAEPEALSMEEISKRIGISLGATSQGLRALEELGVVEKELNGRFGLYSAKLELKNLVSGFVQQRLVPRLEKSNAALRDMQALIGEMSPEEAGEAEWRLQRVTQWHTRAAMFLPLAEKILQSAALFSPHGGK